jgi:hypothetical protein
MSQAVVADLRADLEELMEVVGRLLAAQLDRRPVDSGGWTARQVLAHLADFEAAHWRCWLATTRRIWSN